MYSKYYINGKEVDSRKYYGKGSYRPSLLNGIHEHHVGGKIYSYVYYRNEYLGSIEDVEANRLVFLVRFGAPFEQWCKQHRYKTKEETNGKTN